MLKETWVWRRIFEELMTFRSYGHKPWGHYLNIFDASYTKVKEIMY